jgi:cytochrome b
MNDTTEIKVWDPLVRLFHWALVIAFFTAYFIEDEWLNIHVIAGYTVFGLVVFRLLWGVVGSRYARFSDFIYSPKTTLMYLKNVLTGKATRYIGHNPAGGAMIIILLMSLLVTTLSGAAYYGADQWQGPLASIMKNTSPFWIETLEELHEISANFTVFLVVVHVVGVTWESLLHRENLVRAMIDGRKRA